MTNVENVSLDVHMDLKLNRCVVVIVFFGSPKFHLEMGHVDCLK